VHLDRGRRGGDLGQRLTIDHRTIEWLCCRERQGQRWPDDVSVQCRNVCVLPVRGIIRDLDRRVPGVSGGGWL
jgi:hypothetical protein